MYIELKLILRTFGSKTRFTKFSLRRHPLGSTQLIQFMADLRKSFCILRSLR